MGVDIVDITDVLDCLSKIEISNIKVTTHLEIRGSQRNLDIDELYDTILKEKPVSILKQDDNKFKLGYELTDNYDLTIVISINTETPLTINLVTSFKEESKKRKRKDD